MMRFTPMWGLVAILSLAAHDSATGQGEKDTPAARQHIPDALTQLVKGTGEWKSFSITYDDLHGLHGGLTLTIEGTGKVQQKAVRRKAGETQDVTNAELKRLVELLIQSKAWEQREAARPARPDESQARLVIRYAGDSVTVWEWFNDLPKNQRLSKIRDAMQKAAWKTAP